MYRFTVLLTHCPFTDYGLVEKWPSAGEDGITRVPLLVRVPGGKAGHVVNESVELFDLMATTLAQAGIKAEHTHFAQSYLAQLSGATGDPTRAVFTEGGYARREAHCFEGRPDRDLFARDKGNIYYPKGQQKQDYPDSVGRMIAMCTINYRLVYRPTGKCELYDLASDPQELYNHYGNRAYATVQHDLEVQLLAWLAQSSDVTPFDTDPRGYG